MSSRHGGEQQPTWEEAEAALEAAWDDIERFALDESAAPAPLGLSRPPARPPTRRGHRDPQSPRGSGARDGHASRGIRLDNQRRSGSSRRQVSNTSRPPPAPVHTKNTPRPPLTPLRMGRPGTSGSPQSPGAASFRPPDSPGPRRRLSRRLSQGLVSMNRVAQGLLGQRKSSYKGCPHHGLELCHPCMFRIVLPGATYDEAGKVVPDDKVDEPPAVAVLQPAYGRAARFCPLHDRQLRAADPTSDAAAARGEVSPLPARYAEPRPGWFVYCARCQLTHLAGVRGAAAAAHHPSHCANAAGERSVALWVDADPCWNPRGPPAGRYSLYFGRGSRFNLAGDEPGFAHAAALEFEALARALRRAGHVLALRRDLVARRAISNSHAFLWGLARFRLLVFSPLKALGQWLQTEGPGEAPETVGHLLNFDRVDGNPRQAWLDSRRHLDEAIAWLADLGIEVSFFPWRTRGYTPEWRVFA